MNHKRTTVRIKQVGELPIGLDLLVRESEAEGFEFLRRLVADWDRGSNRFSRPGEALFAATRGEQLLGIAGLNRDPDEATAARIGRVRHFYVVAPERHRGLGRALLARVVDHARESFSELRLRTDSHAAAAFYERCGFSPSRSLGPFTHRLLL